MKYAFKELVDVATLQDLTDELHAATGIPSSIITTEGEVLTASGWQRICTDFHRAHPLMEQECIQSDTTLHASLAAGEAFAIYTCPRGPVDASVPVLIEGVHLVNVFAGQLFTEPPSKATEEFFRVQARRFGLDESGYIEALREVPVFSEERFRLALSFLAKLAQSIASLGLGRLRELETAAELHAEKSRYRIVADNTYDWEFWLDPDGRVNYMSPSCERVSGRTTEDFKADPELMTRIIHPDDRPGYLAHQHTALATCTSGEIVFRMLRSDGEVRWIEHVCGPVFADDGSFLGTRGSNRDVTERRRAEEALRHLERRLYESQKMESLGILAGGIAHDFNNLLTAVLGNADLALATLPPSAPGRENLFEITAACRRAADLCHQMLAYSGRGRFVVEPIALSELVRDMLGLLRSTISKKARLDLRLGGC
jgi:PAS domain S-box-containing protein